MGEFLTKNPNFKMLVKNVALDFGDLNVVNMQIKRSSNAKFY